MSAEEPLALHSLSFAGKLLIWSGRRWNGQRDDWPHVEDEFVGPFGPRTGRALAAVLDDLYGLLSDAAVRPLAFGLSYSRHLKRDEAFVVELVQMEQRHQSGLVLTRLEQILPATAARQAIALVATVAHLLDEAGYDVYLSSTWARSTGPDGAIVAPEPALTLH